MKISPNHKKLPTPPVDWDLVGPTLLLAISCWNNGEQCIFCGPLLPCTQAPTHLLAHSVFLSFGISTISLVQVKSMVDCLWNTLLDLDDLTASTNSIMNLLSTLLAHTVVTGESSKDSQQLYVQLFISSMVILMSLVTDFSWPLKILSWTGGKSVVNNLAELFKCDEGSISDRQFILVFVSSRFEHQNLSVLVPRLWPFLRHNIGSVRKAALETLTTLLQNTSSQVSDSCNFFFRPRSKTGGRMESCTCRRRWRGGPSLTIDPPPYPQCSCLVPSPP